MKKVFLTVLTVVLFSVSGWANSISLESEKDFESLSKNFQIEFFVEESNTPCADSSMVVYKYLKEEMSLTHDQAWRLSEIAFQHCLRNTYSLSAN